MPPATHRVTNSSEHPQDGAYHQQDDPDGPQYGNSSHKTDDKEDDTEDDHDALQSQPDSFNYAPLPTIRGWRLSNGTIASTMKSFHSRSLRQQMHVAATATKRRKCLSLRCPATSSLRQPGNGAFTTGAVRPCSEISMPRRETRGRCSVSGAIDIRRRTTSPRPPDARPQLDAAVAEACPARAYVARDGISTWASLRSLRTGRQLASLVASPVRCFAVTAAVGR